MIHRVVRLLLPLIVVISCLAKYRVVASSMVQPRSSSNNVVSLAGAGSGEERPALQQRRPSRSSPRNSFILLRGHDAGTDPVPEVPGMTTTSGQAFVRSRRTTTTRQQTSHNLLSLVRTTTMHVSSSSSLLLPCIILSRLPNLVARPLPSHAAGIYSGPTCGRLRRATCTTTPARAAIAG